MILFVLNYYLYYNRKRCNPFRRPTYVLHYICKRFYEFWIKRPIFFYSQWSTLNIDRTPGETRVYQLFLSEQQVVRQSFGFQTKGFRERDGRASGRVGTPSNNHASRRRWKNGVCDVRKTFGFFVSVDSFYRRRRCCAVFENTRLFYKKKFPPALPISTPKLRENS